MKTTRKLASDVVSSRPIVRLSDLELKHSVHEIWKQMSSRILMREGGGARRRALSAVWLF